MSRKSSAGGTRSKSSSANLPDSLALEVSRERLPRARKRSPGRPTAKQADELREAVLHAALDAFMTKGFDGASIEGIARTAKVAKITLYRQFGNKVNLFYEVTRYAQAEARRGLQSSIDPEGPPAEVLRQLIQGLHERMTHPNYLAVLHMAIAESQRFPTVSAGMLRDTDFFLEPVINYLQRLKSKNLIDIDNPRDAAIQFSCLVGGGARYLMVRPSNLPSAREHWVDSLFELFCRAWQLKLDASEEITPATARRTLSNPAAQN